TRWQALRHRYCPDVYRSSPGHMQGSAVDSAARERRRSAVVACTPRCAVGGRCRLLVAAHGYGRRNPNADHAPDRRVPRSGRHVDAVPMGDRQAPTWTVPRRAIFTRVFWRRERRAGDFESSSDLSIYLPTMAGYSAIANPIISNVLPGSE